MPATPAPWCEWDIVNMPLDPCWWRYYSARPRDYAGHCQNPARDSSLPPLVADANTPISGGAPRTPAFNASGAGKHWVISELEPLSAGMAAGVDHIYAQRIRSLLSVDDIIADVVALVTAAGRLEDTYFFYTSDHGYNLGVSCAPALAEASGPPLKPSTLCFSLQTFRLSVEKFHHLENDLRVPFLARGPGVPAGATTDVLVNNVDIGATILDLAGIQGPPTDGRSFAAALRGAPAPSGGQDGAAQRDRLLFEYGAWGTGYVERGPCNVSCGMCPEQGPQHMQLLDAPSNTYSGLRIRNATHDWTYAEFRGHGGPAFPLVPSATNWTELYDNAADEYQLVNLAPTAPPSLLASLHDELWAVATCSGAACP